MRASSKLVGRPEKFEAITAVLKSSTTGGEEEEEEEEGDQLSRCPRNSPV